MQTFFARLIARTFHPLLITFYYLLITLNLNTQFMMSVPTSARWMLLGLILITTCILPGLLMSIFQTFYARKKNFTTKETKITHLFIAAIFYFLTYHMLSRVQLSPVFNLFILGGTSLIGVCMLISLFRNVSIYMIAVGALTGALLGVSLAININMLPFILMMVLLSGMTGFSMLALNRHRPGEIYAGYLIGVVGMLSHFLYV